MEESQAGMKIAGRNINNLRYGDDTALLAESEELKSLLMKVKEESEKIGLKLNFPGDSDCKVSAYNVGDLLSIPGLGRSPGEGNGNPLQYSSQENPMDGGAWWAIDHGIANSRTRLSDFSFTFFQHSEN